MPRLCFFNQRFASRAPGVDITSGDCSPSAAGNPPAFDAQPRAAACLTARGAGFGPIDCHIAQRALRGSGGAFSASSGSVDRDPLTPLVQRPAWNTASRIPLQSPDPGLPRARQWRRRPLDQGAFHRGRLLGALLREPVALRCSGWPAGASAARLHRCARHRLDLLSSAFAGEGEGEATRAPAISAGGCLHEHDCGPLEHPDPRRSRAGRLPCSGRKLPSVRDSHRRCSRSGAELPMLDLPGHDCACPRLRPDPDRSEHLVSQAPSPAGLERRGRGNGAADAERACKARPPEGGVTLDIREDARR